MAELILVHGNAVGIEFSGFGGDRQYAEFTGFKKEIDDGSAKIYRWHYRNEKFSFLDGLNPFKFGQLYFEERGYCHNPDSLQSLNNFISAEKPKILLGHSLGALQIVNYLEKYDIPETLKKIVLVQGAYPSNYKITNPLILEKINKSEVEITNFHSVFDQMLWIYSLAHLHMPAGLFGTKNKLIRNVNFTRFRFSNPHLWTMQSREFAQSVFRI